MGLVFAFIVFAAGLGIADFIPAPRTVVERPRLRQENVTVRLPGGASLKPAAFTVKTSLAGRWRFKGLDRRHDPFGPITDAERALMVPGLDDSSWSTIKVPLNWWEDGRFAYGKTYDPKELFYRGFYRHSIEVANPKDGRRRVLRFEEVGAEFDLFVNGRFVAHHFGDFTPVEADVTEALVSGKNLIALRVLADFGPAWGRPFTRIYGAHWDYRCMKGGIWHTVALIETPAIRLAEMLIDPADDLSAAHVRCRIENLVGRTNVVLSAALVEDVAGAAPAELGECRPIRLEAGTNEWTFDLPAKDVKRWRPDDPNLYWMVVVLTDGSGTPVAVGLDRFGFRSMRVAGDRFLLNGEPIYLVGDSLHSLVYGGRNEDSIFRLRQQIAQHKRNGANLLRTAHMPAIPEVYAYADEVGMMIYDEWGNAFCNDIEEESFSRNNLPELEKWVRRDYNHASVVMWSLGNEVKHIRRYDICRQLDRQYDLVKRLDLQNRPVCSFSGCADVWAYGIERLKTDFLDTHRYLGIDASSWTTWFTVAEDWYPKVLDVYGENGRLTMPLIMWECVGAGWGLKRDESMRPGDVPRYLDWAAKHCTWAGADGIGFTGTVGLLPLLHNHRHYVQRYLADRLCELFAQDRRLAGYAPWFADAQVPGATRWFQPVYPLLRNNAANDGRLMFRQLESSGERKLECAVINRSSRRIGRAAVNVTIVSGEREIPAGACDFEGIGPLEEKCVPLSLKVPMGLKGTGEIRLSLTGEGCDGRNAYAVSFLDRAEVGAPLPKGTEVVLAAPAPAVTEVLAKLGVVYRVLKAGESPSADATVVVTKEATARGDVCLSDWAKKGCMLVVLEPDGLSVPGCPFLTLCEAPNHHVELVVPQHPVFEGLSQADFDTWAENPSGTVIRRGFTPLLPGILAVKGRYLREEPYTCALAEHAYGKGRLLISCFDAIRAFGRNPAATRYLRNLFAYVTDRSLWRPTQELPPFEDVLSRPVPTDLNPAPLMIVGKEKPERIAFRAATTAKEAPWKILFFTARRRQVAEKGYRYLTLTFRSDDAGRIDLTIPKQDHRNRLTCTFPTSVSDGRPVTLRLDLQKDFRLANEAAFGLDEIRGEIILYNGYESDQGLPRPATELEILEMKFE